jgi:hypothetical protein
LGEFRREEESGFLFFGIVRLALQFRQMHGIATSAPAARCSSENVQGIRSFANASSSG